MCIEAESVFVNHKENIILIIVYVYICTLDGHSACLQQSIIEGVSILYGVKTGILFTEY